MRAPFCPRGSLAIWTMISWPSRKRSLMAAAPPALLYPAVRELCGVRGRSGDPAHADEAPFAAPVLNPDVLARVAAHRGRRGPCAACAARHGADIAAPARAAW